MYSADMIAKELVAASTEPLILSLLSQGESYGYAIIQDVRKRSGDQISGPTGCSIRYCIAWNATA